ncbi:DeoR/GlpR family DNA-binding transcription regulator [Fictibacillus sp. NPDC058756]|uniref:DeoR/GlpR family DNA-binding transcription regulator n=1 Tax=Fictibacillus sp. NPDC058756 TaxID=3346625 RepID=UPI0036B9916F
MLPLERKLVIMKILERDRKVQIDQLVHELQVSSMTIRRDLGQLEDEGKLIRTHGGAIAVNTLISETPYQSKTETRTEQKKLIAQYAATLIPEGCSLLLDSGTTTREIAKMIRNRTDLTIITNDLKIASELVDSPSSVICTGGNIQSGIGSMLGPHAQALLREIKVDLLFLGTHAIDLGNGMSAPTMEKALIKKLMISSAKTIWLVADSSKFNKNAFSHVCSLNEINGIITDSQISSEDFKRFSEQTVIHSVPEGEVSAL